MVTMPNGLRIGGDRPCSARHSTTRKRRLPPQLAPGRPPMAVSALLIAALCVLLPQASAQCEVSAWSSWSACPCGGGVQTRSRHIGAASSTEQCPGIPFTDTRVCSGDGTDSCHAATTCLSLLRAHPGTPSGVYWVTGVPGSTAFLAHCEMQVAGGGWMMVYANSNSPSAVAASYDSLVAAPAGLDVLQHGYLGQELVGMVDIDALPHSVAVMMVDIANWGDGDFSSVEFSSHTHLATFVRHGFSPPDNSSCFVLPQHQEFVFKNSNGVKYAFNRLRDDAGYGWGDCNPPPGRTNTPESDVEDGPVHWIYMRNSSLPTQRVGGVGGLNTVTTSLVAARMFAREAVPDRNCAVSMWTAWSGCSHFCDGYQTRTRHVTTPAQGSGLPCSELLQSRSCGGESCERGCPVCKVALGSGHTGCHLLTDLGTCFGFYSDSVKCPFRTELCSAVADASNPPPMLSGECSTCWPGTAGDCQAEDGTCSASVPGVAGGAGRMCVEGSRLCSVFGSYPALPAAIVDVTMWGLTTSDMTQSARELLRSKLANIAGVQSSQVAIESVTTASQRSGVVSSNLPAVAVGAVVVLPHASPRQPASEVTERVKALAASLTASIVDNSLTVSLARAGLTVSAMQLNTDGQVIPLGPVTEASGQQAAGTTISGETPEDRWLGSGGIVAVCVAAGLLMAGCVGFVWLRRHRAAGAYKEEGFMPRTLSIPAKPLYLPSSMHNVQSFSSSAFVHHEDLFDDDDDDYDDDDADLLREAELERDMYFEDVEEASGGTSPAAEQLQMPGRVVMRGRGQRDRAGSDTTQDSFGSQSSDESEDDIRKQVDSPHRRRLVKR